MLKKLPAGGGLLSSHPSSPERAKKIEALVARG
jgi:Zn-dependent protease with chaperone function